MKKTTEQSPNGNERAQGGISVKRIMIPLIVMFIILHSLVVILIFSINSSSSILSTTMQNAGRYTGEANSLLAGASQLTNTSSAFVLMPELENGEVNTLPMGGFANEIMIEDRRGSRILEKFQGYDISQKAKELIAEAAGYADQLLESQLYAVALTASVYHLPPAEPFNQIPIPELSAEDAVLSPQERLSKAKLIVSGTENFQIMRSLADTVNDAVEEIQSQAAIIAAQKSAAVVFQRTAMWVITISIIVLLAVTFILLFVLIIRPLVSAEKLISQNQLLDAQRGVKEVRRLASAYNELMVRRDALDDILRSAAETDVLTGLPNRYSYNRYILDQKEQGYAVAVILFDVNFLKRTNDTKGHAAGDELLKKSAKCIQQHFGAADERNCFRMGGDEFAAVVKEVSLETLKEFFAGFEQDQKKQGISIAYGYGYAKEIGSTTFKALMDKADAEMYKRKRAAHGLNYTAG